MNRAIKHPDLLKAVKLCREYRRLEWPIIEVLQRIDRAKSYKEVGAASLFQFAVQFLELSEAAAYTFINVARKSSSVPALREAVQKRELSVAKASRIAAALSKENAVALIEFAKHNSTRAIDSEVARLNPRRTVRERAKPVDGNQVEIKVTLTNEQYGLLKRAQDLIAQSKGKSPGLAETLGAVAEFFVERRDPVRKAERALKRVSTTANGSTSSEAPDSKARSVNEELCLRRVPLEKAAATALNRSQARRPLVASQKHPVFARDGGRCTYIDISGHRCTNQRWLHLHHIRPVSLGGSDNPENLTTLCASHHDLVHQLSFPLEHQVNWLREPTSHYG